jgi:hypothetical protein
MGRSLQHEARSIGSVLSANEGIAATVPAALVMWGRKMRNARRDHWPLLPQSSSDDQ